MIWIVSSKSVLVFFTIGYQKVIYHCLFAFKFLGHALASAIERKIVLARDACSRPPPTIRFHDLHASNNKPVGEIASYHRRD
jgi:hypothetical protein